MSEIGLLKGVSVFDGEFRFNLRAQNLMVRDACSLNLQSETGNPPEGWESEGQIINNITRNLFF
jgi:hypothetical protein